MKKVGVRVMLSMRSCDAAKALGDNEGSGGQAAAGAEKSHRGDGQRRWQRRLLATNAEQQQHEAEKQCRELRR